MIPLLLRLSVRGEYGHYRVWLPLFLVWILLLPFLLLLLPIFLLVWALTPYPVWKGLVVLWDILAALKGTLIEIQGSGQEIFIWIR